MYCVFWVLSHLVRLLDPNRRLLAPSAPTGLCSHLYRLHHQISHCLLLLLSNNKAWEGKKLHRVACLLYVGFWTYVFVSKCQHRTAFAANVLWMFCECAVNVLQMFERTQESISKDKKKLNLNLPACIGSVLLVRKMRTHKHTVL